MNDSLTGYLLDTLDPAERRAVEVRLRTDPEARRKLDLLRQAIAPLAADRGDAEPPPGLVARTLARIAEHFPVRPRRVRVGVALAGAEPVYPASRWRRVDVLIAASILVVVSGLCVTGVARAQRQYIVARCQDNLRANYQSLMTYAGLNGGSFPRIGEQPPRNVAAAYVPILAEGGCLPEGSAPVCPVRLAVVTRGEQVNPGVMVPFDTGYAYTLGYRDAAGNLHGLRLLPGEHYIEHLPIMADVPAEFGHRTGQNVLFIGGHVRFATTSHVGVDGDDIYHNRLLQVAAGVDPVDSALANGNTVP